MKRIFALLFVISLLLSGVAYAEISATAYSNPPEYHNMPVFVVAYNGGTADITSNAVVVLAVGDSENMSRNATGAVIDTTTTQDDPWAFGVTDQVITAGTSGRVCIRGPHKVQAFATTGSSAAGGGALVAGCSMATTQTAGYASPLNLQSRSTAVIGRLISTTVDPKIGGDGVPVEGAVVYWMELGR